jgi:uncharacterized protein (TIGR03067 family)
MGRKKPQPTLELYTEVHTDNLPGRVSMSLTRCLTLVKELLMGKPFSVLLILCFLFGADDATKPDRSKKDLDQMQGTWHAVAMEANGMRKGADEIKNFTLLVKKDDFAVKVKGEDHLAAKLVLRADKKPKELDLVQAGAVHKGIYEIEGDKFKICINLSSEADAARPKEFKTEEESHTALVRWERTK